ASRRRDSDWPGAVPSSPAPRGGGSWGRYPTCSGRSTMPCVPGAAPAMTFRSEVLPAPLRPTSPTLSPACSENDASVSVYRPPTSTASSRTCNTAYHGTGAPGAPRRDFRCCAPLLHCGTAVGGAVAGTTGLAPLPYEVEKRLSERVVAHHRQRAPPDRPVHRRQLGCPLEVQERAIVAAAAMQQRAQTTLDARELLFLRGPFKTRF